MKTVQFGHALDGSGLEQTESWQQLPLDFGADIELRPDGRKQPTDQQIADFAEPANTCGKSSISLNVSTG